MAKAQGKKTTTRSHGGGRHRGGDAARMAALRWLVMKIEQLGIDLRCNTRVGEDVAIETLKNDYDAVVIACGIGADRVLDVPGCDLDGSVGATSPVYDGTKLLGSGGGSRSATGGDAGRSRQLRWGSVRVVASSSSRVMVRFLVERGLEGRVRRAA